MIQLRVLGGEAFLLVSYIEFSTPVDSSGVGLGDLLSSRGARFPMRLAIAFAIGQ